MDPFPVPEGQQLGKEGPWVSGEDNWVSFTFVSDGGYDKLAATVHGNPDFVAEKFGIKPEDWNGKISTLMERAIFIDGKFKSWYEEAGTNRPKA